MLRKSKTKVKSVAEKIEELLHNGSEGNSESSDDDEFSGPKVIEFDDNEYEIPDARSTDIRKRNIKLLSEQSARYAGEGSSRRELELTDEESDLESNSEDRDNNNEDDSDNYEEEEDQSNYSGDDSNIEKDDSDEHEDPSAEDDSDIDAVDNNDENLMPKTNNQAEIQKGMCVQNQLRIWERLLELRIQIQKLMIKSNQLPKPEIFTKDLHDNEDLKILTEETASNTSLLLKSLLGLQKTLFAQNTECKNATKILLKRSCPFDDATALNNKKHISDHLEKQFIEFRPYRNAVLLKWDDRTKLLRPNGGARKNLQHEEYDIIKKIDNALLNKSTLIERSQIFKTSTTQSKVEENATEDENKNDANIYDDSEFYHQQLRELIEYKTNSSGSMSEVAKQFVELQKLRQKIKKKVDTRASKGRKLRYAVHNKLINFMAPNDTSTWTEEATDELTKSLFI